MTRYPFLHAAISREWWDALTDFSVEGLRERARLQHPAMEFRAVGGPEVGQAVLSGVAEKIRAVAGGCRYPAFPDKAGKWRFDNDAARSLNEMLDIQPAEACQSEVWQFFTCVVLPDIVQWRWGDAHSKAGLERYLGGRRNAFQRLWWVQYILGPSTVEGGGKDSGLAARLDQDAWAALMERPMIAGNIALTRCVARRHLVHSAAVVLGDRRDLLRDVQKRIRRLLPIFCFEAMSGNEIEAVVDDCFVEAKRQFSGLRAG